MGVESLIDRGELRKLMQSEEKPRILQKLLKFKTVDELSKALKIDKNKTAKEIKELVGYGLVVAVDEDKGIYGLTNLGVVLVCLLTGHQELAEEYANHAVDIHVVRNALAS